MFSSMESTSWKCKTKRLLVKDSIENTKCKIRQGPPTSSPSTLSKAMIPAVMIVKRKTMNSNRAAIPFACGLEMIGLEKKSTLAIHVQMRDGLSSFTAAMCFIKVCWILRNSSECCLKLWFFQFRRRISVDITEFREPLLAINFEKAVLETKAYPCSFRFLWNSIV